MVLSFVTCTTSSTITQLFFIFVNLCRLEIIAVLRLLQLSCRGKLDFLNGATFEHFSLLNGVGILAKVTAGRFFLLNGVRWCWGQKINGVLLGKKFTTRKVNGVIGLKWCWREK